MNDDFQFPIPGGARLRRALISFLLLFTCNLSLVPCHLAAADFQVVGYVEITNTPAGPPTNIVFNIGTSDTRTFTNGVVTPSTSIQITNSPSATRTNLAAHLAVYPVRSAGVGTPELIPIYSATNTSVIEFWAPVNTNLSISFGGNWAKVYYVTNPFNLSNPILVDTNKMSATARTNAGNAIVNLLSDDSVESNSIPPGKYAFRHITDNVSSQNLSNKTLTGPIITGGRATGLTNLIGTNVAITNVTIYLVAISGATSISGIATAITNGSFYSNVLHWSRITNTFGLHGTVFQLADGTYTNGYFPNGVGSNFVNRGNAISSPGAGTSSEQFGSGAHAYSDYTSAFGYQALATNDFSTAFGYQSTAFGGGAVLGAVSSASTNTATLGFGNSGSGVNGTIVGNNNDANGYYNVVLIGSSLNASEDNEVIIGGGSGKVSISGALTAATLTNSIIKGTTAVAGRLDLTPGANTGLANGYNSDTSLGTNVYVKLSGHSAAATNAGFRAAANGTYHIIQVDNPALSYALLDNSGLDSVANRIYLGDATTKHSTNNPVLMQVIYDSAVSRWRLVSFR